MINVVIFNGGRGGSSLIPSMISANKFDVCSVVNAYDDGKSTGEIRKIFGILGPSDIRKTMALMLPLDSSEYEINRELFSMRVPSHVSSADALTEFELFSRDVSDSLFGLKIVDDSKRKSIQRFLGKFLMDYRSIRKAFGISLDFSDCSVMNCIFTGALLSVQRDYAVAVGTLGSLFGIKGSVLLNSTDTKHLFGIRSDGTFLSNEADIVELRSNFSMQEIFLSDRRLDSLDLAQMSKSEKIEFGRAWHNPSKVSAAASQALHKADIIIFAPGTQHSSLYPTYMTSGIGDAIASNLSAKKIFICNIGADYETPTFRSADYVTGALKYLNLGSEKKYPDRHYLTHILVNEPLKGDLRNGYVENNLGSYYGDVPVITLDYEDPINLGIHSGEQLMRTIYDIIG